MALACVLMDVVGGSANVQKGVMDESRTVRIANRIVGANVFDSLAVAVRDLVDQTLNVEGTSDEVRKTISYPSYVPTLQRIVYDAAKEWEFDLDDDVIEDVVQAMVLDLYKNPRHKRNMLKVVGEPWKVKSAMINKMVFFNAQQFFRAERNLRKKLVHEEPPEEAEYPEMKEQQAEEVIQEMMKDLKGYIRPRVDESSYEILVAYLKAASRKGAGRVRMRRDVYPAVRKRGYDFKESRLSEKWKALKKRIVQFFEKELGKRVSDRVKQKLQVAGELDLRRRWAAWVLGGCNA
jgi:hypothetical protein